VARVMFCQKLSYIGETKSALLDHEWTESKDIERHLS
jgi:hypothetical protein